jgi:hypothetical protein
VAVVAAVVVVVVVGFPFADLSDVDSFFFFFRAWTPELGG